jgi:hypothetical protein
MNKRGGDDLLDDEIMYIILNLAFVLSLAVFVVNSSSNALVYEQVYAKKIAFFIDAAKPDMTISLEMNDLIKFANKHKVDLSKAIRIDNGVQKVYVSLGEGKGYGATYFSSYPVKIKTNINSGNELVLGVGE